MKIDIHPWPGIHKKVLNKTRIIRQFVFWKKLKERRKFLQTAYILQRCLANQQKNNLDWFDVEFTSEPHCFLKCDCGNELITSDSFVSDTTEGVRYKCTDCKKESLWNFDRAPVPIRIKNIEYNKHNSSDITDITDLI